MFNVGDSAFSFIWSTINDFMTFLHYFVSLKCKTFLKFTILVASLLSCLLHSLYESDMHTLFFCIEGMRTGLWNVCLNTISLLSLCLVPRKIWGFPSSDQEDTMVK